MWRVFCKLVDFGGALGNPRERKILHICDSDYTTWGGGKDPRHRRVAPSFVVPIRFLRKQWREYVEVSDHAFILLLCFIKHWYYKEKLDADRSYGDVTGDDLQRFLTQHIISTMLRHFCEWLQHCSNIAMLYCAKTRRCGSFRVTSLGPQGL